METNQYQDVQAPAASDSAELWPVAPGERDAGFVALLEELSQRVLMHWDARAWRELFLGAAHATIRFRRASLTLLLADSPLAGMQRDEARLLAHRVHAEAEVATCAELGMSFRDPATALRAALVLQRLASGRQVRAALTSGRGTIASFQLAGTEYQLVIGTEAERAEAALLATPPGTVTVAAETYTAVAELLACEVNDAVVATELEGERVTRASITLTPRRSSTATSTFAGLGLF